MKRITDPQEMQTLLPKMEQTILESRGTETVEHGHIEGQTARCVYVLPDEPYSDDGEFLGDWAQHLVAIEIDDD